MALPVLALGACGEGVGQRGSVAWSVTASGAEKAAYARERAADARLLCSRDYRGEALEACIRNATAN